MSPVAVPVAMCDPVAITIDSAATGPGCRLAAETVPVTETAGGGGGAANTYANPATEGVMLVPDGHLTAVPLQYGGTVTFFHAAPLSVVFCDDPPKERGSTRD